jgi:tetratricopeptide (TPR) repeat protein
LGVLRRHPRLVAARDDLAVELCALYTQTGAPERALQILESRKFQPWEGGEGQVLGQHRRAHLALGRRALQGKNADRAAGHFRAALTAPSNLGEAAHLLLNQSQAHYWLGRALEAQGDGDGARRQWEIAADFKGDFQDMGARAFSEMTYYSAQAAEKLGRRGPARRRLRRLLGYAQELGRTEASIDYFATSLPALLLFEDDLNARQRLTAGVLEGQARLGLGEVAAARTLFRKVLRRDPSHAFAADLLAEAQPA